MSIVKPFKGLRPPKEIAPKLASLPYDVMNSEEAREMAKDNPQSFLHIVKPEIDLDPSVNLYDEKVYNKAAENFKKFQEKGWLVKEEKHSLYIYKEVMDGRTQIGLVGCVSAEEYWDGKIKKHEETNFFYNCNFIFALFISFLTAGFTPLRLSPIILIPETCAG